ncbi:MAG: dihydrolipoamide acetyltransferase family protein [Myxococcales bacterium]|nr:dihydrolipoamide acetyltransferase family protein [Myxococcales bacterium]
MAKLLDMPKLSPTMEEGQLAIWHKKEGDVIAVDDLLAEVETDKATMEFRSFDKGTLLKILVPAGSFVKLGQPVAILGAPGEDISHLLATGAGAAPQTSTSPSVTTRTSPAPETETTGRIKASPYVRKLAREHNLDLRSLQGSGPGGRIIARDLPPLAPAAQAATPAPAAPPVGPASDIRAATPAQAAAPAPAAPPAAPTPPPPAGTSAPAVPAPPAAPAVVAGGLPPETRPLSMMRKTIARRLTESKQTVPHFYLNIDVDAEALTAFREQINGEIAAATRKGEEPEKISLNDLIVKACATALRRVPECNAQFTHDAILVHQRIDISVAVAVPEGLVTPVLRDADRRSVLEIRRAIRDLAARARAKKLAPEEMSNGTFSISNLGMFGIDEFAAVINPPEGAILAVGRVRDEPVVRDGAVVPGKRLAMTLSCDHRVIDGAVGARFLAELRGLLERPMQILLGP